MEDVFGLLALSAVLAGLYCFMGILMPSLSLPLMRSRRHAAMLWAACVVSFFVFASAGKAMSPPPTPAELQARETQRVEEQATSERRRAEQQQQKADEQKADEQKATEERNAQKQVEKEAALVEKEAALVADAAAATVKARTEQVVKYCRNLALTHLKHTQTIEWLDIGREETSGTWLVSGVRTAKGRSGPEDQQYACRIVLESGKMTTQMLQLFHESTKSGKDVFLIDGKR